MTSEIRTNTLTSRAGLSTVTLTDSGPMFSGITTFVDNSGFNLGTGSSIFTPASNTLTFGTNSNERLRIDGSGNLVTGAQTSPTSSDNGNIYIKNGSAIGAVSHQLNYVTNAVFNSAWKYITSSVGATRIIVNQSGFQFDTAASGTAGNNITFSNRFNINNAGAIGVGGAYGSSGQVLTSAGSGSATTWSTITGTTINSNADNRIITGSGTANTLNGEATLTYDGNTLQNLQSGAAANLTLKATSNSFNSLILDSNRSASTQFAILDGRWNGTPVTRIQYVTGTDGTNKDDGYMAFHTRESGQSLAERLRINSYGQVGINTSVGGQLAIAMDSSNTNPLATGFIALSLKNTNTTDNTSVCMDFNNSVGGIVGRFGAQFKDTSDKDTDLYFATRADGGALTEALRIRSDSKVVIGTNAAGAKLSVSGNLITDDGTNARITLQADGTSTNQILSTTTGFGSYCNMSYQAAAHVFKYGGTETFRINADGTFRGKPDQINGRDTNSVFFGKSFKYTTSNISPSWGSGSNGWYSFYHMSDGVYTFWLHTGAHSSICFTASNGYDPSLKSFITVHHFIDNPNGNYGNVKGIRVTTDGVVQVYLHASAANNYFEMHVQVTCGDLPNMPNLDSTITKETGSPTINDSWGTSNAYSPARGALTTDGVCSPRILHNRREMSCFATSTSLYGANTSGAKGFYWDPDTASCQSAQPRNTGWSSYYINKHDGDGGSENRYIDFWLNNGQQGNITISGSGLNYGSNSDYRLKKDDVGMTDGIARVKQLRPIKFKWIKDDIDDEGFFAHEAQAVVPIAVDGTKDQVVLQSEVDAGSQREDKSAGDPIYQTMDNSKLVPVLTASIKELITKVETLEQENIALRARVTNLEGN